FWVDGWKIGEDFTIDNYDRTNGSLTAFIGSRWGAGGWDGFHAYFDEIMIADAYCQPYVPSPSSVYPDAPERMAVLYRPTSDASVTAADYCVTELGVPRSNLIPLPNATATEVLANYATFETEVEDDLNAWLATNSDAAAQITTFITGYKVPNFFTDIGQISTVSRLMNLGNAYSRSTPNPLYQHSGRVTASQLSAEGMYCATAIDAPNLVASKAIVDGGVTANAVGRMPEGWKFYSDSAAVRGLLAVQKTRLEIVDAVPATAGIVIAWLDGTEPGENSRWLIVDTNIATLTLRTTFSSLIDRITTGWPCGIAGWPGWSDYSAMFNTFHAGGCFAEACITSRQYVDSYDIVIGIPNLQVDFPLGGYN
ncbi:hypothetical protein LCGC14_2993300, partial [marine sediment metagenome]